MDPPQDLDRVGSVHVRQAVIDYHDVGKLFFGDTDALFGRQSNADYGDLRIIAEETDNALENHLVIVDHHDADHRPVTHCDRAPSVHLRAMSPGRRASPAAESPFPEHLLPEAPAEHGQT